LLLIEAYTFWLPLGPQNWKSGPDCTISIGKSYYVVLHLEDGSSKDLLHVVNTTYIYKVPTPRNSFHACIVTHEIMKSLPGPKDEDIKLCKITLYELEKGFIATINKMGTSRVFVSFSTTITN
jgi:hypothetical protein